MDNKELLKKLGIKIRILRDNKNMSQEYLAEIADIDRGYLGKVENGKTNLSVCVLYQIAAALEIDVKDLFDFTI